MSYQLADFAAFPIPKDTQVVTATVRYPYSKLFLHPEVPDDKLLDGDDKGIRMVHLSPDFWMLLRHRYDCSASSPYTHRNLNADQVSSLHSNTTNQGINDQGEGHENRKEEADGCESMVSSDGQDFGSLQQTHSQRSVLEKAQLAA